MGRVPCLLQIFRRLRERDLALRSLLWKSDMDSGGRGCALWVPGGFFGGGLVVSRESQACRASSVVGESGEPGAGGGGGWRRWEFL